MKKFTFSVCRTSTAWAEIEIIASSEEEATATALDLCGDQDYKEKDADYSIEHVTQEPQQ